MEKNTSIYIHVYIYMYLGIKSLFNCGEHGCNFMNTDLRLVN